MSEPTATEADRTGHAVSVRLAAVFLPASLPRRGRIALWDPDTGVWPEDGPPAPPGTGTADPDDAPRRTDLTVVRPHGRSVRRRTVPALTLPLQQA
ncbi:hypothetical protein, partial [Streptomyces sp. WAC00469]